MELIDIITADGLPTGATKSRDQIHADGEWHRTAHVWVMNSREELLLQKRAATKESHPGLWDVSCAGHIAAGDTSRLAAVRELREELGLDIRPKTLHFLFTSPSFFVLNDGAFIDRELIDVYLLKKDADLQRLVLQPEEVESVKWMPLEEFRAMVAHSDPRLVPHTQAYRRLLAYLVRNRG